MTRWAIELHAADRGLAIPLVITVAAVAVLAALIGQWIRKRRVEPFLNRTRQQVTLVDRILMSHDTVRLVLALDHPQRSLGLPVGQHIIVYGPNRRGVERGRWNGREDPEAKSPEIQRKYTPVSKINSRGRLDLVVKIYQNNHLPLFPDGGKMSQFLAGLRIGDRLDITGPIGRIRYRGWGIFDIGQKQVMKKKVGMIAGGTGITPIFQLAQAVLENITDDTELSLIYANKTEDDILLREELEAFASGHPRRFKLWFTLEVPPTSWRYSTGYVTSDMVSKHLPVPGVDTLACCCGPPQMVELACKANLMKLGYDGRDIVTF